ncbi:Ig-like domain-containing protein [Butyrivibrio sp. AE3006]|uniref:Ig-like domain-containing protein n=1 Tax=Butyrivibrio sp. AE3006 TaxID=1280673 RepID=UPI00041B7F01|nr:Ig-like domain-containing protein [Butyrivibrio sp. AE3006]
MKTLFKRDYVLILSMMLVMGMLTLMPEVAVAEGEHIHNGITFEPWNNSTSMPQEDDFNSGNTLSIYLTTDVTLTDTGWTVPSGKTVYLCLNGKKLKYTSSTSDDSVIIVPTDSTINIYDEENKGEITGGTGHGSNKYGGGIFIQGTVNLHGGKICGNQTEYAAGGIYILNGTLNMLGGEISNNSSKTAGGVAIYGTSTFEMHGGKISNNKADISGGGVDVKSPGTFTLDGGEISGNIAGAAHRASGGGVLSGGDFIMNGGKICGNQATGNIGLGGGVSLEDSGNCTISGGQITDNQITGTNSSNETVGGGVYVGYQFSNHTFKISGNPKISGNTMTRGGSYIPNNVYLDADYTVSNCITVENIGANASVGVSLDEPRVFTTGLSGANLDPAKYFVSDNQYYKVVKDAATGEATLAPNKITKTVTFRVVNGYWSDGTTEDKRVTLSGYGSDVLKLTNSQIPKVGDKPGNGYKAGSWDVTPGTGMAITSDKTFTYTYIAENNSENQPETYTFNTSLKITQKKGKIKFSWDKTAGIAKYEVYVTYYGKKFQTKPTKTVKSNSVTIKKIKGKKIDFTKNIKLYIKGYDSDNKLLGETVTAVFAGKDSKKYKNPKQVKLSTKTINLSKGNSARVKASVKMEKGKRKALPEKYAAKLRYRSDNPNVASVDKKGLVTAVNSGSCSVYVFAKNGLAKKVAVTVN